MVFRSLSIALGATTLLAHATGAAAFLSPSRVAARQTARAVLPDSLEIPDFTPSSVSATVAAPKVAAAVAEASDRLSLPDVAASASSVAAPVAADLATAPVPAVALPDAAAVAGGLPSDLLPIGLGAIAFIAIGGFLLSRGGPDEAAPTSAPAKASASASSPPPSAAAATALDLSIPYDAAARLAYGNRDEAGFAAFKRQYEADTVRMVTEKRKARGTGY